MRTWRTFMATAVAAVSFSVLALPPLAAAASPPAAIRAVYRTVLTAEYFGPASAVCGNLTAAGIRAFTAAAPGQSCTAAYDQLHHTLHHKQPDNDNSGYTATAYRGTVATFMANLTISVRGARASVHGPSGLGPSKLVEVGGHWRFSAYPPTVES
ncbi:MAG: hypothetical protein ACLPZR_31630 [Solirubrobacteraceae bacterium]